MRSVTYFLRSSSLKCSKQTFTVHSAIVNWVELIFLRQCFSSEANRETKKSFFPMEDFTPFWWHTRRHWEIKKTRSRTKQDFSEEALSKQNTVAQLASLSFSSIQATTEWSAIFAWGVGFWGTLSQN